jgi:hypothetical protein
MSETVSTLIDASVSISLVQPINQIIELATGQAPTATQLAGWEAYEQAGGSLASIASSFVASTMFANNYNHGTPVNPDAPITTTIATQIIENALGEVPTAAHVAAWVDTGLPTAEVFQGFAVGDQFTNLELVTNLEQNGAHVVIAPGTTLPSTVVTGELTGTTTSDGGNSITGIFIPAVGGLFGASVGSQIVFDNAPTETLAYPTGSADQVNVTSASSLGQALDMAAATDASSQSGGLIPANSGVIDWFQYGGDTYVVEAINPTSTIESQTALTATDAVVKLVGLVDLTGEQFAGDTLTI